MTTETVEDFKARAAAWAAANLPKDDPEHTPHFEDDLEDWTRQRELQKKVWEGGFAGICFPKEYGGLGLTREYQQAYAEAVAGYQTPTRLNVPTFSICAAVILDMGTEEQKQKYVRGALTGEIVLCQFLSEPKGGSDLAGVITRAERDGDTWVLNGNKIWSTAAYGADYGLCLARTDWDAPKHRGLSMFIVPIKDDPGFTLRRIRMVSGDSDFCEEFFENLVIPGDALLGEVNDGWTVASRQLVHERTAVGGASLYVQGPRLTSAGGGATHVPSPLELARELGKTDDPDVQDLIGNSHTWEVIHEQVNKRVGYAIAEGILPPPAASIMRLFHAENQWYTTDARVAIAADQLVAPNAVAEEMLALVGDAYLMRQGSSLGGGSTEMARNIISERVLGMPREFAADRDVPFREVRQGR